ncbi:MAG: hypothetical protein Q9227_002060 [Pyrenula ochraceoflavens]
MAILAAYDNLGNHQQFVNGQPKDLTYRNNVCEYILESLGFLPIAFAKISMLWLYKRIFRGPIFIAFTWTMIVVVIAWGLTVFFGNIFTCTPISIYLHETQSTDDPRLHCVNSQQMTLAHGYSDVFIDFVIMVMPWPTIWTLQMDVQRKIAVTVVFVLGCLTIAASSARLAEFYIAGDKLSSGSMDITYVVAPAVYYTHIEASLGIVTVSVPALRPLFRGMSPERMLSSIRGYLSLHSSQSSSSQQSLREKESKPSMASSSMEQARKAYAMPQAPPPSVYTGQARNGAAVAWPQHDVHGEWARELPANCIAVGRTWETSTEMA